MREHPAHAYGIGQFGTKAKPTTVSGAAGSAKSRQIMQLQDTLVHNPGMSDREKSQVQEKISSLTAEKKVLDWKDANPGTPTIESYEAQKSYYDRLWQQNQDAIVNGLGNGTLKQGSDEWYELFKKGDDLLAMKDAYNRGMMGLLDGDKAQTAMVTAGGGGSSAGFDANDGANYIGETTPGANDEENADEGIKPYLWSQDESSDNTTDLYTSLADEKDAEKQAIIAELDDQMAEEIALANELRQDTYERAYKYFDENIDIVGMSEAMIGQISSSPGIDASGFSDEELKEAFAQSTWELDDAYDVSVDDIVEDIREKYDRLKEDALANIDEKFKPYERVVDAGFTDLLTITDMLEDSEVKDVASIMLGLTKNEDGAFSDTSSWSEVVFIPDEEAADEFYKKYVDDPEALAELNNKAQGWEVKILALPIVPALPQFGFVLEGAAWLEEAIDVADIVNNSTHLTDKLNVGSYYVKYNNQFNI